MRFSDGTDLPSGVGCFELGDVAALERWRISRFEKDVIFLLIPSENPMDRLGSCGDGE
jgi:hypothetical protein